MNVRYEGNVTNLSLLSNLRSLSLGLEGNFQDQEMFKDLGLFTNLLALKIHSYVGGFGEIYEYHLSSFMQIEPAMIPPSFSNLSNLVHLNILRVIFQSFK